jgi:hypothetical protein
MLNAHFSKINFMKRETPANNGIMVMVMTYGNGPPASTVGEALDEKLIYNK